jgi:hypothetical protein
VIAGQEPPTTTSTTISAIRAIPMAFVFVMEQTSSPEQSYHHSPAAESVKVLPLSIKAGITDQIWSVEKLLENLAEC